MKYVDVVMLLNFAVNLLLLVGTDYLSGYPPNWNRALLAAAIGGVYSGMCLLPRLSLLGNGFVRILSLTITGSIAFGLSKSAARRTAVFALISTALGGIALGIGAGGMWAAFAAVAMMLLLCYIGFGNGPGHAAYVPVELTHGGKQLKLTALYDTGNLLRDPISGDGVLVIDARSAESLTGLTAEQLRDPISVMATKPIYGLRLIPYRSVGQPAGFLLAMRLSNVKIGKRTGSCVVAFAPHNLSVQGSYQALAGGTL